MLLVKRMGRAWHVARHLEEKQNDRVPKGCGMVRHQLLGKTASVRRYLPATD